jgi:NAD(P)H dehydrogenase (quinone)
MEDVLDRRCWVAMNTLAITGSTGQLGGRIARRLEAARVHQRLLVRDPARAPALEDTEVIQAEYDDVEAVRAALHGVDTLLMVSASESFDRVEVHKRFVDAAAAVGVGHLVYTSLIGAAPDSVFTLARDHWATEQHIRSSGIPFTFLRDNLYADFAPLMVGPDDVIRGPAGDGSVAVVTQDDIADAATAVLLDPSAHVSASYDLTGPESLTLDQIAGALSRATGRAITYHSETLDEAYRSRASYGAPSWQVDAWVSTYTSIAAGEVARVSQDIPELTGHPATTLAALLATA